VLVLVVVLVVELPCGTAEDEDDGLPPNVR
jgi:hypothetical protein